MRFVFKPVVNVVISIAVYSLLGLLFYVELDERLFLTVGMAASGAMLIAYAFYLRRFHKTTERQHLAFLVLTLTAMLAMLYFHTLTIKQSDYFLLFLALASLPPFYHYCGYVRFARVDAHTSLLKYAAGILLAPFLAFLVYNHYQGANYKTIYVIVIVGAYYFVLFSLIKIAALALKNRRLLRDVFTAPQPRRLATILLMLVMPLTGLLLNQYGYSYVSRYAKRTGYLPYMSHANEGFFGDFSHPIFYALTILNAILLLTPPEKYQKLRLPMFYARALGYSFIAYMFVVFMPVLPVGVLTLFFIVGIYAFVPLAAAWWQSKIMIADYRALLSVYKKSLVRCVFLLGFLTLPMILAFAFAYDKANFQKALAYADRNRTDVSGAVDIPALKRTLDVQEAVTYPTRLYDSKIRVYFSYKNIPILSGVYKLYVYGGKELTWECRSMLGALFFNEGYYGYYDGYDYMTDLSYLDYRMRAGYDLPVRLAAISHDTRYDESIGAYRTQVDLVLENQYGGSNSEYTTQFYLPDGVYVSDYYLDVMGVRKKGLLTDRRAALSVYQSIVLRVLDPGVLHYADENLLELRVFPFAEKETRRTGFELIHTNALDLWIDGQRAEISAGARVPETRIANAVLLSADEIARLPFASKGVVYHFILDCSEGSDIDALAERLGWYCGINGIADGYVYLTGYRLEQRRLTNWRMEKIRKEGGFNLNLAVKNVVKNADGSTTPIVIYITDKPHEQLIVPRQLYNYAAPESDYYYRLSGGMGYEFPYLTAYSMYTGLEIAATDVPVIYKTAVYDGHSVRVDGYDQLVILNETPQEAAGGNQYLEAMALAAENTINRKNGVKNPTAYIARSFAARVLTPSTAFIVVETKEQEEELLRLQQQLLDGQAADEARNLSEPGLGVLVLLLAAVLVRQKRKRTRQDGISLLDKSG